MTNPAITLLASLSCAALLSCAAQKLVGEDRCFGTNTECGSDAPTHDALLAVAGDKFELAPTKTIEATWTLGLPCEEPCSTQIARGPEGGVWATVDEAKSNKLLQVTATGRIAQTLGPHGWSSLSVDGELRPHLMQWLPGQDALVVRYDAHGARIEHRLIGSHAEAAAVRWFSASAEGGSLLAVASPKGSYVARYDAQGALEWRQSDLRAARHYPFEDLGPGLVALFPYGLTPMPYGSLLVELPKYTGDDEAEVGRLMREQGITALDADGNLRWDANLGYSPITSTPGNLVAGPNGALAYLVASYNSLIVLGIDESPSAVVRWDGIRTAYHGVTPYASCIDSAGVLYVLLRAGTNDAPTPLLCKFNVVDAGIRPECATLVVPEEVLSEPRSLSALMGSGAMVCPAQGQLVLSGDVFRYTIDTEARTNILVGVTF